VIVFAAVVLAAMAVITETMTAPVSGKQGVYSALFNDASGLYAGSNVRLAGVAVGKVESVEVDGALAKVTFTAQDAHAPEDNSEVAIRYQNLIGQRYLEIVKKDGAKRKQKQAEVIPPNRTVSSFDITELFNGIAPLINEIDPAELNKFAENMQLVLQGDGAGLGPALQSISKIASFTNNRDKVIGQMIENMNTVASEISGRSGQVAKLMTQLNATVVKFTGDIGVVQESLDEGDRVLVPFVDVLETLVGALDNNRAALEGLANRLVPATPEIIDAIKSIPGLLEQFTSSLPPAPDPTLTCSRGHMDLSDTVQVLVGGKKVVACR
jgi:phospholipid/cholesterol/gamma-HCH transport system substrate-binding protein